MLVGGKKIEETP